MRKHHKGSLSLLRKTGRAQPKLCDGVKVLMIVDLFPKTLNRMVKKKQVNTLTCVCRYLPLLLK
jgi:hypothetical protein